MKYISQETKEAIVKKALSRREGKTLQRLEVICKHVSTLWDIDLLEFGGEKDHIHLLFSMHPNIIPSRFVNNLKTVTSRLIRKEFPNCLEKFYWKPVL